jgi:hypothetical protein
MNYAEMKVMLEYYVDDEVDNPIALRLLNEGKNRMALAVHAKFPDITQLTGSDEFVFDDRFHNTAVLYAAAMVKTYDSSIAEAREFENKFELGLREFVENYDTPIQYTTEPNIQNFTVTAETAVTPVFRVTDRDYNMYGDITVYLNGNPVRHQKYGSEIRLYDTPAVDDIVTIQWDQNIYGGVQPWSRGF